jgi:hypothetical protein
MIEQRTPEWFAARLGKVTASRVADVIATHEEGLGREPGELCKPSLSPSA